MRDEAAAKPGRPMITLTMLRHSLDKMNRAKAGSPDDGLVVEHLKALRDSDLVKILGLFNKRLWGEGERPNSWRRLFIWLIPKEARAKKLSRWRPIVLMAVVAKWFDGCLDILLDESLPDTASRSWGFKTGRQPAEIIRPSPP